MDLAEQLDAHGCTFLTVGAVFYTGLVCGNHFGDKSVKYNTDVRHYQVYWYICQMLVWCASNEYIVLPGFKREDAPSNTELITGYLDECTDLTGAMTMDELKTKIFPSLWLQEKEKEVGEVDPAGGEPGASSDGELD